MSYQTQAKISIFKQATTILIAIESLTAGSVTSQELLSMGRVFTNQTFYLIAQFILTAINSYIADKDCV